MVLSILYGRKYPRAKVGTVVMDATITEDHRYTSRVTHYPVENGAIVSDHIINEPDVVVISGIVTDTPLNILSGFNRSVDAFNRLVDIHKKREVISLVTGIKVYPSMAITLLDVPRNIKTGQSLTFNIELQAVTFDTSVRLQLDQGNPLDGVRDITPQSIVADNSKYPILQFDPPFSLKDQASSAIDVGIQSLQAIPTPILPNILENLRIMFGVA